MNITEETGQEWMRRLFEYEWCEECGGDERDHDAIPFMGNWFARCKAPLAHARHDSLNGSDCGLGQCHICVKEAEIASADL